MHYETIIALPKEYREMEHSLKVRHEEEAICWLWAFPSLLLWNSSITWLYTPVVGNKRWPGDLWGIDCNGDLLIIEAKRCERNDDAFIDFGKFHYAGRKEISAMHWERKWTKHLKAELSFRNGFMERPKGKTDGILPRSNKRQHIRLWAELAKGIDVNIRSENYKKHVVANLQTRDANQNPTPYYFALMIQSNLQHKSLKDKSMASAKTLQKIVGRNHVAAIAIHCEKENERYGRIGADRIHLPGDTL